MSEFYRNYLAVAVFIGAALLMVGAMLGVGRLIRPSRPRPEKLMPYEAGPTRSSASASRTSATTCTPCCS